MDLVTAEDWCGMLRGDKVCAEYVLCVTCMFGMSASPPTELENTHRWLRRRKCEGEEKEILLLFVIHQDYLLFNLNRTHPIPVFAAD